VRQQTRLPKRLAQCEAVALAYIEDRIVIHNLGSTRGANHKPSPVGAKLDDCSHEEWNCRIGTLARPCISLLLRFC
jgi:hypothetical protein